MTPSPRPAVAQARREGRRRVAGGTSRCRRRRGRAAHELGRDARDAVFSEHPDIVETLAPPSTSSSSRSATASSRRSRISRASGASACEPGHDDRFDDLRYGEFAIDSYATFARLRDEGVIPRDVRFQVCLPAPHSAIDGFFDDAGQWPELDAAYSTGSAARSRRCSTAIPAEDLAIQWDVAWKFVDMAMGERNYFRFWPKLTVEEKSDRHAALLDDLSQVIPDETLLGFHWCYGTWGGWPMTAMPDLALCVRISNETKRDGRRFDCVHMPVVRQPAGASSPPLDDLDVGDTRVYLGMVHHTDTIEDFHRERDPARTHLALFGIGCVCGYGRVEPELLPEILRVHAQDAREL